MTPMMPGAAVWMAPPACEELVVAPPTALVAELAALLATLRIEDVAPASPDVMLAMALEADAVKELIPAEADDSAPSMAVLADALAAPPTPKMVVEPMVDTFSLSPSVRVVRIGAVVTALALAVSVTVPVTLVTRVVSVVVAVPEPAPAPAPNTY